jgi:hypothetical protein
MKSKKRKYWMLTTYKGNPKIINMQLPIYYTKKAANSYSRLYNCDVKEVWI